MAKQAPPMKKTRTRYSQAYKDEALALADRVGASAAARELGLQPSQLYQWRAKAQQQQSASAREQALAEENARLKRQLAETSEELEIAKNCLGLAPACRVRNSAAAYTQPACQRRSRRLFGGLSPLKNVVRAACWT